MPGEARDAVWLDVLPSMKGFGPALAKGSQGEAAKAGAGAGHAYGKAMIAGVAIVAAGAVLATKALYNVGKTFDKMSDTIRVGTGATGKNLDALVASAKSVGSQIPASFEEIGSTIADVNTRLGLTGPTLEKFSKQILEVGRMTNEKIDINKLSAAFSAFDVKGAQTTVVMDDFYRISQATGVGVNELATSVATNGSILKQYGFTVQDSAALIGTLDKAGLDSNKTLATFSRAMVQYAKDGKKPKEALRGTVAEIEKFTKAGNDAAATNVAAKIFGTRGAAQFVAAVKSGKVNLNDLMKSTGATGDTILGAAEDTASFSEKWMVFKNKVLLALEPIAKRVFNAIGDAMGYLGDHVGVIIDGFGKFSKMIGSVVGPAIKEIIGSIKAFAAAWKYNDGDITSSGMPGFFERLGFIAHQAFDIFKTQVLPRLRDFAGFVQTQVIPAVQRFAGFIVANVIPALVSFGQWLGPKLITGAKAVAEFFMNRILPASRSVASFITGSLVPALVMIGKFIFTNVMPILRELWSQFKTNILPALQTLAGVIITRVVPTLVRLAKIVAPVIAIIAALGLMIARYVIPIVLRMVGPILGALIRVLGSVLSVVTKVIKGMIAAFKAVGSAVMWTWRNVLSPAFGFIKDGAGYVADKFGSVKRAIGRAWDAVSTKVGTVWTDIKKVFGWMKTGVGAVQTAFSDVKAGIARIWGRLIDKVSRPINAVLKFIQTKFINPLNSMLDKIGLGRIIPTIWSAAPTYSVGKVTHLASGGVLPGYTPRRDVHQFYSPTGGNLALSGGEAFMVPEFTRAVGGKAGVDRLNAAARAGRAFKSGGIWDSIKVGVGAGLRNNFTTGGAMAGIDQLGKMAALGKIFKGLGSGIFGRAGKAVGLKALAGIVAKVKAFGAMADGSTGGAPLSGGPRMTGSWQSLWAMVHGKFPWAHLNSAFRPNAIIHGTNILSQHAKGKAIDVTPSKAIWDFLLPMRGQLWDLLGPWGGYFHGGPARYNVADHQDHIHLSTYANGGVVPRVLNRDQGGILPPGLHAVYNGTGGNEMVLNQKQQAANGATYNVYAQNDKAAELVDELMWRVRLNNRGGVYAGAR